MTAFFDYRAMVFSFYEVRQLLFQCHKVTDLSSGFLQLLWLSQDSGDHLQRPMRIHENNRVEVRNIHYPMPGHVPRTVRALIFVYQYHG